MVIRMRHTRSHTKNRRSHHALKAPNLSTCSHCGESHRPHHMCLSCGYYNGRMVMDLASEKAKRDARIKAKAERISSEMGVNAAPAPVVVDEKASTTDDSKTKEKKTRSKKPAEKPE